MERGAGTRIHREGYGLGVPRKVASKVAVQAQAVPSSPRDVYNMAAAAGRIFSLDMSMHLKISAVVCE